LEQNKAGAYEVIGTLSDPASPKPDFVKEIVKVHNKYVERICHARLMLKRIKNVS